MNEGIPVFRSSRKRDSCILGVAILFVLAILAAGITGCGRDDRRPNADGDHTPAPAPKQQQDADRAEREAVKYIQGLETDNLEVVCVDTAPPYDMDMFSRDGWMTAFPLDTSEYPLEKLTPGGYDIVLAPEVAAKHDFARLLAIRRIRVLHLAGSLVDDRDVVLLASHPCIRVIDLTGTRITDAALKSLSRLKTLERVYVSETQVTGKGIRALSSLPRLRIIGAGKTRVSDLCLDGGFPSLERIGLHECALTKVTLRSLPELRMLDVVLTPTADVVVERLDTIRALNINYSSLDPVVGTLSLDLLPRLEILDCIGSEHHLEHITNVPRLRELRVGDKLSDRGLLALSRFVSLRRLNLQLATSKVTREGVQNIGLLSDLRRLQLGLDSGVVPSDFFAFLARLHELEELSISGDIQGDIVPYLASLKKLRSLSLSGEFDEEHVPRFSTLSSLEELRYAPYLASPHFRDQVLKELEEMRFLHRLRLTPKFLKEGPARERIKAALPDTQVE